jgi:O-antigen ligase
MDVSILAWLAHRARPPTVARVPRAIVLAAVAFGLVSLVSAALSGPLAPISIHAATRTVLFLLFFLSVADLVREATEARALLAAALAGGAVSAAIGLLAVMRGTSIGLLGHGQDFGVGGIPRISGTFDYPTTAAMGWELAALGGIALLAGHRRALRGAALAAIAVVAVALLLTLSRGAVLGAICGLATVAAFGLASGRRRPAVASAAIAIGLPAVMLAANLALGLPLARLLTDGEYPLYGATYRAPATMQVAPGAAIRVPIEVTNTGESTWRTDGRSPVRLSYHWMRANRDRIATGGARTPLPGPVAPGASVSLTARLQTPDEPGTYLLAWDLVHERVAWFSERGAGAAATQVTVDPRFAQPVIGSGTAGPVEVWRYDIRVPTRAELWAAALRMVADAPAIGVGPGLFRLTYGEYLGWARWDVRTHANDLYLEVASTTGLVGLASLLALLVASLARPVAALRRDGRTLAATAWYAVVAVLAASVAFLVHGVVDHFLGFAPTALLFMGMLGIGVGLASGIRAAPTGAAPRDGPSTRASRVADDAPRLAGA